jgi:exodeoxyribonuclease V beta subunit
MTMHVSKGLEFPVVFIAGGLTQPSADAYHVYHDSDPERPEKGIRKIIDLSKKCGRKRHDRERNEEDKRLFYVALTRARFKLYVPFLPVASGYRWVGPVCRFLSSAVSSAFEKGSGSPGAGWLAPDTHRARGAGEAAAIGGAIVSESTIQLDFPLLPLNKSYQARRTLLESFSSLHSRLYHGHLPEAGFRVVREKDRQDDEGDFAFDSDPLRTIRPEAELPGGADIGSMFHDIFEHIDFQAATGNPGGLPETTEAKDLIVEIMNAYRVEHRWLPQVCRMVADTLTTPVHAGEQPILLSRVKKEDRIHEVEFYYPFTFPAGGMLTIPDCEIGRGNCGFIRGFVDLIFRHNGKYFIVDWKSNRIEAGYGRKALEACMKDAGYHLQYKLYAVAVRRWLKQALGDRFDPDRQLGGVFYLFLRGMGAGNGNGVYFVSPAELGNPERLEAEIAKAVR